MSLTFCTTFLLFLENIFTQQPSYYSDLEKTVPTVLQVKSAFQPLKANSRRMYSIYVDLNISLFLIFSFAFRCLTPSWKNVASAVKEPLPWSR